MSHEFPIEDFLCCSRCGDELPGHFMHFMANGEVLCPDCYEIELDEVVSPPLSLGDQLDLLSRRLDFLANLPKEFAEKFKQMAVDGLDPFRNKSLLDETKQFKIQNFNSIALRTVNEDPSSICSLAIVFVRGGVVEDEYNTPIRPYSDPRQCKAAGINEMDIQNAPMFKKAWNRVKNKLKDDLIFVSHDSIRVEKSLRAAFKAYNMGDCDFRFKDTKIYSRMMFHRTIPDFELKTVAEQLRIDFRDKDTNNVLSEAEICAEVAMKVLPVAVVL